MPKSVPSDLNTHLQQQTVTICTLWKITRSDGVKFFFTDHDDNITLNGDTYLSAVGYNRTAIENSVGLSVDSVQVSGFIDSTALDAAALRAGLFDFAKVTVYVLNWSSPSQGTAIIRSGSFGEVITTESGMFNTQLNGMSQPYSQNILEIYQPICRTDLGSKLCKVVISPPLVARATAYVVSVTPSVVGVGADQIAIAAVRAANVPNPLTADFNNVYYECTTAGTTDATTQPTYNSTVGATTTDGTAVFTARNAWLRSGVVATVSADLNRTFTATIVEPRAVDDWFKAGAVTWDTGDNAGIAMEVKSWVAATSTIELFLPMGFNIKVGDKFGVYRGCNKSRPTCHDIFNNMLNRRAEDDIPGWHVLLDYPDR